MKYDFEMEKYISSYSDQWKYIFFNQVTRKHQLMSVIHQSHLDKGWAKFLTNQRFSAVALGYNSNLENKSTFSENISIKFNKHLLESITIGTVQRQLKTYKSCPWYNFMGKIC